MSEVILTDENFDFEVINSKTPVLVDFWAAWCGPCKMQEPIVDEVAKLYTGKNMKIAKLNVDEAPRSANRFQVMSIPTLMIFKDGRPMEQMIGVQDKRTLMGKLDKFIS
ncbi:MAG TPA: thioredoxin [Patescibacteria group bacterium]|nr:thioredoxin [Patescibacteria group bacterium]